MPTKKGARPSPLDRLAKRLKVSARKLQVMEVKELTAAKRAAILNVKPGLVKVGRHLSPSFPRDGEDALDFYSPLMVNTGEVNWSGSNKPKTGLALFSSKYWQISQPAVQVEFKPEEQGKKYLVELYLTCLQGAGSYQFRIIPNPGGTTKDITVGGNATVLTEVVQTHANFSGNYSVNFMQLNPKTELLSWYFHKLVITKAG